MVGGGLLWLWSLGVLLVNAYTTYQMVMKDANIPKKHWFTHYQFRKAIAMAWVSSDEPTIFQRRKNRDNQLRDREEFRKRDRASAISNKDTSSRTRRKSTSDPEEATNASKERAPTLKDNILLNKSGPLAERLNCSVGHFPTRLHERGARCSVHRWCAAIEVKADVYKCSHCRINLCVDCFEIFHQKVDLVAFKEALKEQYLAIKRRAANSKTAPTVLAKKTTRK
jgi:hypothetical protein